jgi:parvulin-like peptidyl-prolyl isomerase
VITLDYCSGAVATAATKTACKKVITKAEFDSILDAAIPKSRRPAGTDVPPQVKQAVAREYLNMYVMAREAERRGYEKKPLAQEMLNLSRMQVLSMVLNQELQEKTKPTDSEIQKYYDDNPSAFIEVGLRRLYIPKPAPVQPPTPSPAPLTAFTGANAGAGAANVAAAVPKTGDAAKSNDATKAADAPKPPDPEVLKAAAEKIRDRAAAGEDLDKLEKEAFEAAGNKQTAPPTQMGSRRRGVLPPDQDAEVFALNPGQVSKLIENPGGFYLYKVETKRTQPLSEVKDEIQRKLQPEKLNDARTAITGKVKSDFNEKYFGGAVAGAPGSASAPAAKSASPTAGAARKPTSSSGGTPTASAPKTGTAKTNSLTRKSQTANAAH